MLDKKISDLINEQINKELYSAYLYLDISNYYNEKGLVGFGNWYKVQAQEEMAHAMLFLEYMHLTGQNVTLEAIEKPAVEYKDNKTGLETGLEHERCVTASINNIYSVANELKDYKTVEFLTWFIKEQREEETNAEDLLQRFELYGMDPRSLYMLDKELEARVYVAPSLVL
ncbi:MAG: ferritin [Christensenellaceae bacterium]|nr:ferritin [Christensenellaceae bacterium]